MRTRPSADQPGGRNRTEQKRDRANGQRQEERQAVAKRQEVVDRKPRRVSVARYRNALFSRPKWEMRPVRQSERRQQAEQLPEVDRLPAAP